MEAFTHLSHSPDVVPSDFHLFWPLKEDLCECNSRSEEEVIRQCTVVGSVTKWLLLRNLGLSESLKAMCRTWQGLHRRIMQLYFISFCSKSLYIIFPVFIRMTLVFIYGLFNGIFNSSNCSVEWQNDEWILNWKQCVWTGCGLMWYTMAGLRIITKNLI
jgi:hypothetical protein